MKVKPLADRVVIKSLEAVGDHQERHRPSRQREGKAAGGGSSSRSARAAMVDGKDVEHAWSRRAIKVIYSEYAGTEGQDRRRGTHHRADRRIFSPLWNKPVRAQKEEDETSWQSS